jgi:hypothetical protein
MWNMNKVYGGTESGSPLRENRKTPSRLSPPSNANILHTREYQVRFRQYPA